MNITKKTPKTIGYRIDIKGLFFCIYEIESKKEIKTFQTYKEAYFFCIKNKKKWYCEEYKCKKCNSTEKEKRSGSSLYCKSCVNDLKKEKKRKKF